MPVEKTTKTIQSTQPPRLKLNLDTVVSKVRTGFGKDKSAAAKISTGASISRPEKDSDFILWDQPGSPWQLLTGTRGLIFGRITQIAGKSNSGKSSHAMQLMKLAQDQGVAVVLIDSENKFSKFRFENHFGGDASQLLITSSKMILEAGNHLEQMIHAIYEQNKKQKVLIVWDSLGGSLARNEGADTLDSSKQMAAASKENGSVMRAIVRLMEEYKDKENNDEMIACLLINQSYANIGAPGQVQSGGQKVEYYSSLIIQLTRRGDITKVKDGMKIKTGIETRAKVSKNHVSDSETSVSELQLVITAGGIRLLKDAKLKSISENSAGESELEEEDEEETA
jgi:RecA/RadA recombinase